MPKASARHILVPSEEACLKLKEEIENGADFGDLARQHSKCPSGASGGELGTFNQGQMVKPFDDAVFTGKIGETLGPVQTQFGYHLIQVTERTD